MDFRSQAAARPTRVLITELRDEPPTLLRQQDGCLVLSGTTSCSFASTTR